MNNLTSRQRKLVYAGCIVFLLIPIVYLGAPTSEDVLPGTKTAVSGGLLAQMRVEHDLGESTLGEIDPSSAAMNLVLLGLRGPAAGILHLQALEYQEKKNWGKLKTTVDSIIKLQPHYVEIWKFQGWNLAFNVSREWDKVADRFYWVKEGIKFLQLGTTRNQTTTILFHNVGDFMGRKFGNSDEKKFFRRFFVDDPDDERFPDGSSDPVLNPQGKDNYLVAKDWFDISNDKDANGYPVKGMTHVFFRQAPSRALFDHVAAMQDDYAAAMKEKSEAPDRRGLSEDDRQAREADDRRSWEQQNRSGWDDAYAEWTDVYGNDIFLGLNDVRYKLNCSADELTALAKENGVTLPVQRKVWEQNVKMVNYRFWQNLADCERDPLTVSAHRAIADGKVAYSRGEISDAEDRQGVLQPSPAELRFADGLNKMAQLLAKYPTLAYHDAYIDEILLAVHYWKTVQQYNNKPTPANYPLQQFEMIHANRQPDIERDFMLENRGSY
ncbi:MAG: hypothetical protein GY903_15715 [Fuerstiella sp.]|nr:hypothetical protein [Fuerstiella sp.]MCP4855929.1 hypothetical protein [Fuerstiella sp.]